MEQISVEAHGSYPDAKVSSLIERSNPINEPRQSEIPRGACNEISVPADDPTVGGLAHVEVHGGAEILLRIREYMQLLIEALF